MFCWSRSRRQYLSCGPNLGVTCGAALISTLTDVRRSPPAPACCFSSPLGVADSDGALRDRRRRRHNRQLDCLRGRCLSVGYSERHWGERETDSPRQSVEPIALKPASHSYTNRNHWRFVHYIGIMQHTTFFFSKCLVDAQSVASWMYTRCSRLCCPVCHLSRCVRGSSFHSQSSSADFHVQHWCFSPDVLGEGGGSLTHHACWYPT